MAFVIGLVHNNVRINRAPRDFKERKLLQDICDREIKNYRLNRDTIQGIIDDYSVTEWANSTQRSYAISPETEVSSFIGLVHHFRDFRFKT